MDALLSLEARLFIESCEVKILEGEEAQRAVAEVLSPEDLTLEPQS
ncbi:hypothetical protein [Variovorax sp. 3P27G3]|jgi:hypothetical protein|nr:hypothetical protein [Variovorax sp. 3P27G3]